MELVLELHPHTPMSHKEIFSEICTRGLKDASSPASLACLNAMLHAHSRGPEAIFYRVFGATSVFGLKSDIPSSAVSMEVDEDSGPETEDSESGVPPALSYGGVRHSMRQQKRANACLDFSEQRSVACAPVAVQRSSARVAAKSVGTAQQLSAADRPQTMSEILASLPGLGLKDLLTRHTLSLLPPLYQYRLVQLLPAADRCAWDASSVVRLSGSALSNEFFARACQEWRERLADGELTHESRLRARAERERASRLDPWKVANFEDVWGHRLPSEERLASLSLTPGPLAVPSAKGAHKSGRPLRRGASAHRTSPSRPTPVSRGRCPARHAVRGKASLKRAAAARRAAESPAAKRLKEVPSPSPATPGVEPLVAANEAPAATDQVEDEPQVVLVAEPEAPASPPHGASSRLEEEPLLCITPEVPSVAPGSANTPGPSDEPSEGPCLDEELETLSAEQLLLRVYDETDVKSDGPDEDPDAKYDDADLHKYVECAEELVVTPAPIVTSEPCGYDVLSEDGVAAEVAVTVEAAVASEEDDEELVRVAEPMPEVRAMSPLPPPAVEEVVVMAEEEEEEEEEVMLVTTVEHDAPVILATAEGVPLVEGLLQTEDVLVLGAGEEVAPPGHALDHVALEVVAQEEPPLEAQVVEVEEVPLELDIADPTIAMPRLPWVFQEPARPEPRSATPEPAVSLQRTAQVPRPSSVPLVVSEGRAARPSSAPLVVPEGGVALRAVRKSLSCKDLLALQRQGASAVCISLEPLAATTVARLVPTAAAGNGRRPAPDGRGTGDGACGCNLRAMAICRKCGAFCHDGCIGPSRLCVTCLIR
ncbi:conserved hypothetical protein [Ixodes scapularis]|uniref:Polycomb group protein ASXL2 n=1 Tax=Ixodes scapularis TaxID=6945 RepID=B7PT26_IXOSC|nr:conserved hypothetical protein [Ixodes scapularis]|eukprot:XP_002403653.1 conserved hypothetical protein [Ixodes scapularis]